MASANSEDWLLLGHNNWRDTNAAFTKQELLDIKNTIFPSIPSFKDGTIASSDIPLLFEKLKWPRTPEVTKAYQAFWDRHFNGRLPLQYTLTLLGTFDNTTEWLRELLRIVDLDLDGFVSSNEFELLLDMLRLHDPTWPDKTFNDFVSEADLNKDGKISMEECVIWVDKNLPKK